MKRLLALTLSASLLVACGASTEERATAQEALKTLRKIQAATQVGLNHQQYGQLLIEAKAAVNDANRVLPNGRLKGALNQATETYQDAAQAWQAKFEIDESCGRLVLCNRGC